MRVTRVVALLLSRVVQSRVETPADPPLFESAHGCFVTLLDSCAG